MRFVWAVLSCLLLGCPGFAEKRAFVVGVQNYDELTPLTKTVADAEGYKKVFEDDLDFEVTTLIDPTFSQFLVALSEFQASIEPGDDVVFIFSGHGWSDGGRNFLAMRDAPLKSNAVVLERLTFDINGSVIAKFREKEPNMVVAIIDACRNNPFDLGTKSVTKGLVPQQTVPGTLIAYAAGANQFALDRLEPEDASPYSVFTRTLLPKLGDPSKPLMRSFDEARNQTASLAQTISHAQRPAIYSDISLDYCFSGACSTDGSSPENAFPMIFFERRPPFFFKESELRINEIVAEMEGSDRKFVFEIHTSEIALQPNFNVSEYVAAALERRLSQAGIDYARYEMQLLGAERPLPGRSPESDYNNRIEVSLAYP